MASPTTAITWQLQTPNHPNPRASINREPLPKPLPSAMPNSSSAASSAFSSSTSSFSSSSRSSASSFSSAATTTTNSSITNNSSSQSGTKKLAAFLLKRPRSSLSNSHPASSSSSALGSKRSSLSFASRSRPSSIAVDNTPVLSQQQHYHKHKHRTSIQLPPVAVNDSYTDLTGLFDKDPCQQKKSRRPRSTMNFDYSPQPSSNISHNGLTVSTDSDPLPGVQRLPIITHQSSFSSGLEIPDYSYYADGGSFRNTDNENSDFDDDDNNSIQPSPVNGTRPDFPFTEYKSNGSSLDPHRLPSHQGAALYNNNSNDASSRQDSSFQPGGLKQSSSTFQGSGSSYEPVKAPASNTVPQNSQNANTRGSISAVAKVKSMFPGFGSYKALNKPSPRGSEEATGSYNFPQQQNALANNQEEDAPLVFSSSQPKQHFHEIELGPTYKAKVTPFEQHQRRQSLRNLYDSNSNAPSPSMNRTPSLGNNNVNNVNNNRATNRYSSERDQLLLQQRPFEDSTNTYSNKRNSTASSVADNEALDFVPNLRPPIDPTGSRMRVVGSSSSNSLVMTKSQYDKYKQELDTKKERRKKKRNSSTSTDGNNSDKENAKKLKDGGGNKQYELKNKDVNKGLEEENDEDDDDDQDISDNSDASDDDSETNDADDEDRRIKRLEEDEERKKQTIRMRLRQDAHLAVYRQKMTKLTGSQIGLGNYPALNSAALAADFDSDNSDEDEYDDVPLGILQAHGFPTSSRLKTARSQPNLMAQGISNTSATSQGDALGSGASSAYLLGTATPRPLGGDAVSVRSFGSPGRSTTPAPEEGYLAMRNPSVGLPAVFGQPGMTMNRGLIGEIAKEEEAKLRRKSIMNNLAKERTNTLIDQIERSSVYQQQMLDDQQQPQQPQGQQTEIQAQLSQMMALQTQILQQMQIQQQGLPTQPAPSVMNVGVPGAGYMTPMQPFAPAKNWSSFDMMNNPSSQSMMAPMMRGAGGAPSIRSYSPSIHGSIHSNEPMATTQSIQQQSVQQQQQPPIMHPVPQQATKSVAVAAATVALANANNRQHKHTNSTPSFKFPKQAGQQQQQQQQITIVSDGSVPAISGADLPPPPSPSSGLTRNPSPLGTSVQTRPDSEYMSDNGDDDDDDDEAGWKEMVERRKQFRRSLWNTTAQGNAPSALVL